MSVATGSGPGWNPLWSGHWEWPDWKSLWSGHWEWPDWKSLKTIFAPPSATKTFRPHTSFTRLHHLLLLFRVSSQTVKIIRECKYKVTFQYNRSRVNNFIITRGSCNAPVLI